MTERLIREPDMDKQDKAKHAAKRRSEIIGAASRAFDANGYAATTMDAVAAEAGVAKGSLYNYFPSKRELFIQVFTTALGEDEQTTGNLLTQPVAASKKVSLYVDFWFSRLSHYKRVGGLVLEFWANAARDDREGQIARIFQQMYSRWHSRISAIITEGVASGEFRSDINIPAAAMSILASTDGITLYTIMNFGAEFDRGALETMKQGMIAGLVAQPASQENKQ